MTKKLTKSGNSKVLTMNKTMLDHLGVEDHVEVEFEKGRIVLKAPMTVEQASRLSGKRFKAAYKKLSE